MKQYVDHDIVSHVRVCVELLSFFLRQLCSTDHFFLPGRCRESEYYGISKSRTGNFAGSTFQKVQKETAKKNQNTHTHTKRGAGVFKEDRGLDKKFRNSFQLGASSPRASPLLSTRGPVHCVGLMCLVCEYPKVEILGKESVLCFECVNLFLGTERNRRMSDFALRSIVIPHETSLKAKILRETDRPKNDRQLIRSCEESEVDRTDTCDAGRNVFAGTDEEHFTSHKASTRMQNGPFLHV